MKCIEPESSSNELNILPCYVAHEDSIKQNDPGLIAMSMLTLSVFFVCSDHFYHKQT